MTTNSASQPKTQPDADRGVPTRMLSEPVHHRVSIFHFGLIEIFYVCHAALLLRLRIFFPVPPRITSDLSIRDMTVIAGEPFTITVPYTANPKPRPSWSINGEEVLTSDRIKFDTTDIASQFINKKAKRSDTGTYTIYLTNTVGTDSASCRVLVVGEYSCETILPFLFNTIIKKDLIFLFHYYVYALLVDKPSPPQGPLDISDITPETCTLSWKAPFDDGGSPVTNYIVEKLDPAGVSTPLFLPSLPLFFF